MIKVIIKSQFSNIKDSQKFKKTKTPRVTDEGWNFQKQLSGPVEKKSNLLYPHPKFSLGIGLYSTVAGQMY